MRTGKYCLTLYFLLGFITVKNRICNRRLTNFTVLCIACNRKILYHKTIKAAHAATIGGFKMILADKIIELRKKSGWSQEELASQLGVTRQSVSKWEGAQSVPDMDKILSMSRMFGVSTDILLKDELELPGGPIGDNSQPNMRKVTMEEASEYLKLRLECAPKIALAVFLCVISPVTLILLAGLSEEKILRLSENSAAGIGLCVLIILIAAAVSIFISVGAKSKKYEFLEKEAFETEYGVSGMVKERKSEFSAKYTRLNIVGAILCILSVLPLFAAMCLGGADFAMIEAVCILLVMVAFGCVAFIRGGVYHAAMEKLLEEGDYTRQNKKRSGVMSAISVCYWLVTTAVYLLVTFSPSVGIGPEKSWFVWAISGVLYGAVMAFVKIFGKAEK